MYIVKKIRDTNKPIGLDRSTVYRK